MLSLSLTCSTKILKLRTQHASTSISFMCSVTDKACVSSDLAEQVMIPTLLSSVATGILISSVEPEILR